MIKNYFVTAWRNLLRNKLFSIINILGLAIGLACFILIYFFVGYELSFDSFHKNADRIYRLSQNNDGTPLAAIPAPFAPAIAHDFSEIKNFTRVCLASNKSEKVSVGYGDKVYNESKFFMADPSFFEIFSFPIVEGNSTDVLLDPNSVVITGSTAKKYFGNENPIGKEILLNGEYYFTVTAIAADVPVNSHIHFDFIVSFENHPRLLGSDYSEHWGASNFAGYFLLQDNVNAGELIKKIADNSDKYPYRNGKKFIGNMYFEPITEIHVNTTRMNFEQSFDMKYIYMLSSSALIILFIASINFINLSTAQSGKRAKEVGLRKVVGSTRTKLIFQFISESILTTLLALMFAIMVIVSILDIFVSRDVIQIILGIMGKELILILLITILLVGFVAGSYPAFYISKYEPALVLKSNQGKQLSSSFIRNSLVVSQFVMSVVLLIVTMSIDDQIDYMLNQDVGWDKDSLIKIPIYDEQVREKYESIKNEILRLPDVQNVSASSFTPDKLHFRHGGFWPGKESNETTWVWVIAVDYDFVKTYGLDVIEGRDFDKRFPTDKGNAYLLNEAAVDEIGWQNPIGKQFTAFGDDAMGPVVGVVKNFHFRSFYHEIEPVLFNIRPGFYENLTLRISGANQAKTISDIRNTWERIIPGQEFEYSFVDNEFQDIYKTETTISNVIGYFTIVSLFIACIGLFGLAAFITQQRKKEISIRKVLGSSANEVTWMLLKQFFSWVAIAVVVAVPIAYYVVIKWLSQFAYQVEFDYLIFLKAGVITLAVTGITVAYLSLKASYANPIEAIRNE